MDWIDVTLRTHGGDPASLRVFGDEGPGLLPYATLTAARNRAGSDVEGVYGIYEWQDRPLLLLVDGSFVVSTHELARVRRAAAMRGDIPYIALVSPGSMRIFQVGLDDRVEGSEVALGDEVEQRVSLLKIANSRPQPIPSSPRINDVVLRLLSDSLDELSRLGIDDATSISLVGRSLFIRFLHDRNLIAGVWPTDAKEAKFLFSTIDELAAISSWLDSTFNGDFLPLEISTILSLPSDALAPLGNILHKAPGGQLELPWAGTWEQLDFAHIPVGVLSQAYERYLSRHQPELQKSEGGYYTPRHIADLMIKASFNAIRSNDEPHLARVLDPAAGAGVFLITAFRELVAETWRFEGVRPNTQRLRKILLRQLRGFDKNEAALRFAALGLYLIAIELDPNPEPVEKLKFDNLRPNVLTSVGGDLFGVRSEDLGSLGPVQQADRGAYDIVVGNPPWSSSTGLKGWPELRQQITAFARNRTGDLELQAPLPNEVLDLPFIWRAMEWAKEGGQIAFALHARFLFQRGETMPLARNALFKALDITGIVNGTELRRTQIWPEITAPFCLIFARNSLPTEASSFRYSNPFLEPTLNNQGLWRIDVANSETITNREARERPDLLKILFRGTRLDLELIDRISSLNFPSFGDYWKQQHRDRSAATTAGNGYQRLRSSSGTEQRSGMRGVDSSHLVGLPEVRAKDARSLVLDVSTLSIFDEPRVHRARHRDIFRAPILLVKEAPPVEKGRIITTVSNYDVVFNQSFHGYSAAQHARGPELIAYLSLVLGSKVALWYALMTSGRFGFERDVVEKFVIEEIPIPPLEEMESTSISECWELFEQLARNDTPANWRHADEWVADRFSLSGADLEIIDDTLEFRLPYSDSVRAAQSPPSDFDVMRYAEALAAELTPWANRFGAEFSIQLVNDWILPWRFYRVSRGAPPSNLDQVNVEALMAAADRMSLSELIIASEDGQSLLIGRLNQARFWSLSQAKLAARRIVWDHIAFLSGE